MVSCFKKWGFNTSSKEDGWGDCVCSINSLQPSNHIRNLLWQMRNSQKHVFPCRTEYFKNSFSPHANNEWKKHDPNIRSSSNYNIFRNGLLKFIRPVERKIFNINDPFWIKISTRLKLRFSHLCKHKFRYGFKDIKSNLFLQYWSWNHHRLLPAL